MEPSGKDIQITYNQSLQPLADLLADVKRPGKYFSGGDFETPMPALRVAGVGPFSFPVPAAQARTLIAAAERAPYGRGDQTLVDESVRRVWQIAPDQVFLKGKAWPRSLSTLTALVAEDLGCDPANVAAEFYKLVVYEEGSFFAAHRDTEKSPGMFGTLVIALPSAHEGGDLIIRHDGREATLSLQNDDPGEIRYAAFYADCEHEVRPVTRGHRVCLVYNLVHPTRSRAPAPPDHRPAITAAADLLRPWAASDQLPRKLVYLLEHHYTQSTLSLAALKGSDAARAAVLTEAANRAHCALHLGIVHIEESGWAEYSDISDSYSRQRGRRYWADDEDEEGEADEGSEFEVGEVDDGIYFIDQWRDVADTPVGFGEIALGDAEVLPVGALDAEVADEQHFSEATGNEGASFERTYLRAALVLWPQARFDEVCASAGLGAMITRFGQLVAEATLLTDRESARARVCDFAALFPAAWPDYEDQRARIDALAAHLVRFGDADLIVSQLTPVLRHHYSAACNRGLTAVAAVLGPVRAGEFFATLMAATASAHPDGCLALWRDLAARPLVGCSDVLNTLLDTLIAAVPHVRPPIPRPQRIWRKFEIIPAAAGRASPDSATSAGTLASFLVGLHEALDLSACLRFLTAVEGNSAAFPPPTLLLPTLEQSVADAQYLPGDVVVRLWSQCAEFLLDRSAAPPPEPTDWRQDLSIPGSRQSTLLRELKAFAQDPHSHERRFRVATEKRSILHQAIDEAGLDMTHVTERRGRPYTLVCTKTRAAHERIVARYQSDLAGMRRLLALSITGVTKTGRCLRNAFALRWPFSAAVEDRRFCPRRGDHRKLPKDTRLQRQVNLDSVKFPRRNRRHLRRAYRLQRKGWKYMSDR